jgi:hypothetical protein
MLTEFLLPRSSDPTVHRSLCQALPFSFSAASWREKQQEGNCVVEKWPILRVKNLAGRFAAKKRAHLPPCARFQNSSSKPDLRTALEAYQALKMS